MERINIIDKHVTNDNLPDVVICYAKRTPLGKAKRGQFKETALETMLHPLLKDCYKSLNLDPALLGEICIGNVLAVGSALYQARLAQTLAEIPQTVPISTCNRLCSSGLQSIAHCSNAIKAGQYPCAIAGGFESMSMYEMTDSFSPEKLDNAVFTNTATQNVLMPMGFTSDNVCKEQKLNRKDLDMFALESHEKALNAQTQGWTKDEILPIEINKSGQIVTCDKDEGIRVSTYEKLESLKPVFNSDGLTTAANSSQTTDGAAIVLLASRKFATEHNLPVMGVFKGFRVAGCAPEIMGVGPSFAIPKLCSALNIDLKDVDVIELNEAFASQATYCIDKLNLDKKKVNPRGGAIALGHPLGMTGARMIVTLLSELKRTGKNSGIVSMCIGTGMGAAAYITKE